MCQSHLWLPSIYASISRASCLCNAWVLMGWKWHLKKCGSWLLLLEFTIMGCYELTSLQGFAVCTVASLRQGLPSAMAVFNCKWALNMLWILKCFVSCNMWLHDFPNKLLCKKFSSVVCCRYNLVLGHLRIYPCCSLPAGWIRRHIHCGGLMLLSSSSSSFNFWFKLLLLQNYLPDFFSSFTQQWKT